MGVITMTEQAKQFQNLILNSSHIVFLGGAGVSTESNIPDFRSNDGLYNPGKCKYNYPPEVMLSHSFYKSNTAEFFDFYFNQMIYKNAKPNPAHHALAKLEKIGKLTAVVTQNIDGLHQLAGSKNVYELHGSITRNYCEKCHSFYNLDYMMENKGSIPRCTKCNGVVKPDVVLYEESLDQNTIQQSVEHIAEADLLIVGGTSLSVYPAAGLIEYFRGKNLVLINHTKTSYDELATIIIRNSIGEILQESTDIFKL